MGAAVSGVSAEEGEMRRALIPWGRTRWPNSRVMEEFECGGCRADLAFVQASHIAVVEIKSSRDTLERLPRQIESFLDHVPEVWIAVAPKWLDPLHWREDNYERMLPYDVGEVVVENGVVEETIRCRHSAYPHSARVNPLLVTPLLHLAHLVELKNIAAGHNLTFRERWPRREMMQLLAHKLTGEQLKAAVCRELRARPRGWAADEPLKAA
jgi:hypothetical protein